ncbi:PAS domain S-box protein [Polluticoccus soli]|uniref:PAS domain S-box protein n=1 Tax=Polluticoccus soli TaxID=3034150 RepID=UPI0023E2774B|nr:PAS domain S-box protein [Flavipsychrobacter sp. JY13-12]
MTEDTGNDYKKLFFNSPVPMYIYERGTYKFLAVNRAALEQYGYTQEEFLSMTALDIRPEEDWEKFSKIIKSLALEYLNAGTWRHIRKNGELFFVRIHAHQVNFNGTEAVAVFAIDIDETIKTQNALQEKSREVEDMLDSITDGFFALNKNWEFTYVNNQSERILRHPREYLIGRHIWDTFPEALNTQFFPRYVTAMNERVSVHFEEYYAPLEVWVSVNAYPTKEGIAVYFLDITEQKKSLEKIHHAEQRLRTIINSTQDIIWSIDSDLNIVDANNSFWRRVESITGKTLSTSDPKELSADLVKRWQKFYQKALDGEAYKMIWQDKVSDNTVFKEVTFNPIYDRDKKINGLACYSRDVTDEYLYREMIERQNEQLKNIAWIQSHKVRNHVATILGLSQLFDYEHPDSPVNCEVVHGVIAKARELDDVIKEINDLTLSIDSISRPG